MKLIHFTQRNIIFLLDLEKKKRECASITKHYLSKSIRDSESNQFFDDKK